MFFRCLEATRLQRVLQHIRVFQTLINLLQSFFSLMMQQFLLFFEIFYIAAVSLVAVPFSISLHSQPSRKPGHLLQIHAFVLYLFLFLTAVWQWLPSQRKLDTLHLILNYMATALSATVHLFPCNFQHLRLLPLSHHPMFAFCDCFVTYSVFYLTSSLVLFTGSRIFGSIHPFSFRLSASRRGLRD